MPPKRTKSKVNHASLYEEATEFITAASVTPDIAAEHREIGTLENLELFEPLKSAIVRLYRQNLTAKVSKETIDRTQEVITECIDFFKETYPDNRISSEHIVFCHPYVDSMFAKILYNRPEHKPDLPPENSNFGLTHTYTWQAGKTAGERLNRAYVIGLRWDLLFRPNNNFHELRDTVLHELTHVKLYLENIDETVELYEIYERHQISFSNSILALSTRWFEKHQERFVFTNCGPHHPLVKRMKNLTIEYDPENPDKCRAHIEKYFDEWDKLYDKQIEKAKPKGPKSQPKPNGKRPAKPKGPKSQPEPKRKRVQ